MTTEASIVVEYGDDDLAGSVVVELDGDVNLDDDGNEKTTFNPGDGVYFLVHHDDSVKITKVKTTAGSVELVGTVTRTKEEQVLFTNTEDTQELSYNPDSVSISWYGNEPSSYNLSGKEISVSDNVPCICDVSVSMQAKQYYLTPPDMDLSDDETYPVAVVVYVEAV